MLLSSPMSHKCDGQNYCFIVELVNRVVKLHQYCQNKSPLLHANFPEFKTIILILKISMHLTSYVVNFIQRWCQWLCHRICSFSRWCYSRWSHHQLQTDHMPQRTELITTGSFADLQLVWFSLRLLCAHNTLTIKYIVQIDSSIKLLIHRIKDW